MQFHLKVTTLSKEKTAAIVVGVDSARNLSAAARHLDEACQGQISRVLENTSFEGRPGQTLPLHALPGISTALVLVTGTGDAKDLDNRTFAKIITGATKALNGLNIRKAVNTLTELEVTNRTLAQRVADAVRHTAESCYRFDDFKSKKGNAKELTEITFTLADKAELAAGRKALAWGEALAAGIAKTRDLGNSPGNVCTPGFLADEAKQLTASSKQLKLKVLGEAEMTKLGFGAFMAVSRGSDQEGKLIIVEYSGGKAKEPPVVLVGKGVTFDTGGISLKPGAGMDEMKFDMCGAASVMGVMTALARSSLPVNVIGVMACAENMPSGRATKPGDVVTSLSGQTIEILNTDAEGRLVLCDALTYIARYKPKTVIDIATLTGACVVALGKVVSGLFSPDDELAGELLKAGDASGDRAWRMPVLQDYQELLDSPFADMANIGGPNGGAITAACFLARYTKDYRWAHLDIAGTAWNSGAAKGATGRPVPLLMEYLRNQVAHD